MARILVVDDNQPLARTLASYLEMEGHVVDQAHDGESALHAVGSRHPEVVVLDINIPNINGLHVCQAIRSMSPQTSVLIVSGRGGINDQELSEAAGASAHLTKPVSLEVLQEEIRRALARA